MFAGCSNHRWSCLILINIDVGPQLRLGNACSLPMWIKLASYQHMAVQQRCCVSLFAACQRFQRCHVERSTHTHTKVSNSKMKVWSRCDQEKNLVSEIPIRQQVRNLKAFNGNFMRDPHYSIFISHPQLYIAGNLLPQGVLWTRIIKDTVSIFANILVFLRALLRCGEPKAYQQLRRKPGEVPISWNVTLLVGWLYPLHLRCSLGRNPFISVGFSFISTTVGMFSRSARIAAWPSNLRNRNLLEKPSYWLQFQFQPGRSITKLHNLRNIDPWFKHHVTVISIITNEAS